MVARELCICSQIISNCPDQPSQEHVIWKVTNHNSLVLLRRWSLDRKKCRCGRTCGISFSEHKSGISSWVGKAHLSLGHRCCCHNYNNPRYWKIQWRKKIHRIDGSLHFQGATKMIHDHHLYLYSTTSMSSQKTLWESMISLFKGAYVVAPTSDLLLRRNSID